LAFDLAFLLSQLPEFVVPDFKINSNSASTDEGINLSSDFANMGSYKIEAVSELEKTLNLIFCSPPPTT
jgi:hypothetical protein